jgi:hypothetical protein
MKSHLAGWARRRAATHQGDGAGGVMRAAGRAQAPAIQRELAGQAGDRGALQCFVHSHRGEQAGESLRQHRLAGTRRAEQQLPRVEYTYNK